MTYLFIDSAYPYMNGYPIKVDGVAGYIGGDTPHQWTASEWKAQTAHYHLPIYVRSNPPGPGAGADVAAAVSQLKAIGCPKGSLVAWDMETAVDASYISSVYSLLSSAGYKLIVYGSGSMVHGNNNPSGLYWVASWDNNASLEGSAMHQYASNNNYDESVADTTLPFWDPSGPTPPPPPPPNLVYLTAAEVEQIMGQLPILQNGATDANLPHWYVHRIQAICNDVYGQSLTVDGAFGPGTEAGVKSLQAQSSLTQDGVVGPQTWSVLITGVI